MAKALHPANRRIVPAYLLIAFACAAPLAAQSTQPATRDARATGETVLSLGITVSDLDRSVAFFTDVLTFEKVDERRRSDAPFARLHGLDTAVARIATLRLGDEAIELTQYESPPGRAFPPDTRSNDRWFQHIAIIVSDMDRAYARLSEHNVRAASRGGPQRLPDWNKNAAGIRAYYFRDPDGHFLEILSFPPGKGDPKRHAKTDRLFLGIDHTAIVVADTEAGLRFYRDLLGMRVVGGSENHGPEQEALNHVVGARLRITTLRAARGPAIELLEYLQPRDGRPYPADAHANDLLHWQTKLASRDVARLSKDLRASGVRFVSAGAIRFGESALANHKEFIVRDPDGHALKVVAATEASLHDPGTP